jgi:hypothetical protein
MPRARGIAATAICILLALAAGAPTPVQAYCPTVCKRTDPKTGQCLEYGTVVGVGCSVPGLDPAAPAAPRYSYGAIAYGRTSGAWGYSHRWGSQAKAESVAKENCAQHGDDCEVMVWFDRRCGAVVASDDSSAFWGLGASEAQARTEAQNKCANGGGKACEVQVSHCSM